MDQFITYSGWACTLISTLIAWAQYTEKKELRNQLNIEKQQQLNRDNATGHQAQTMTINNK